jgi:hypothetical protein
MTTYKNAQNFHGDWYFKITGRRTSTSDGLCMYDIKIATTFSTNSRQLYWPYMSADVGETTTAQELRFP